MNIYLNLIVQFALIVSGFASIYHVWTGEVEWATLNVLWIIALLLMDSSIKD